MKRFIPLLFCICLLAGCSMPNFGKAATAESAAASTIPLATPATAASQSLRVSYFTSWGSGSAAQRALFAYGAANNCEVSTNLGDVSEGDLCVLPAAPAPDSGYRDLSSDPLLAAAGKRAGIESGSFTALPMGKTLYAYWADSKVLYALLGEDCLYDLQNATWAEWSDFAQSLTAWIAAPAETTVTLNGKDYALPAGKPEAAAALTGVFTASVSDREGWADAAYTPVLLAAGAERTADTLTGPLNALYSAFELEEENRAPFTGDNPNSATGEAAYTLQCGEALFYRGKMAEVSWPDEEITQRLVPVAFKCDFTEEDITNAEYSLNGLMNYPVLANLGYLAIPDSDSEEGVKAAASAMLWLYTDGDAGTVLTDALTMITPWNTASESSALGALQVQQVSSGILPGADIDADTGSALQQAVYPGGTLAERKAFIQNALAAFGIAE